MDPSTLESTQDPVSLYSSIREWWIMVNNKKEGPYSIRDLKNHPHFTLDTLVWKEGFYEWVVANEVPELRQLFDQKSAHLGENQLILTMEKDPYQLLVWILLIALILLYLNFYAK